MQLERAMESLSSRLSQRHRVGTRWKPELPGRVIRGSVHRLGNVGLGRHRRHIRAARIGLANAAWASGNNPSKGFTDDEGAAMKERAKELKAEARRGPRAKKGKADGESDALAKIAAMQEPDRAVATRLHAIIKASAPALAPKTWYGMPAYARDGNVVSC